MHILTAARQVLAAATSTKLTNLLKKVPDEARASEGTFFLSE